MLHINSRHRSTGSFDSFELPLKLDRPRCEKVKISLADIALPSSQYNFDSSNNIIPFSEGAGPTLTATITAGIYTLTELKVELKTQLEAAGALTYTITDSGGKITIAATGAFTLKWTSSSASASYRLGWGDNYSLSTNRATDTGSAVSHTSTYSYNLAPANYLYLSISGLPSVHFSPRQHISATFPLSFAGNSYACPQLEVGVEISVNDSFFSQGTLRVDLKDELGALVDIGTDWGFTLAIVEC
jgi:hypothetical protein